MTTISPFTSSGRNKIQASAKSRLLERNPLAAKAVEKAAIAKILRHLTD
jgi:hypothetical protein